MAAINPMPQSATPERKALPFREKVAYGFGGLGGGIVDDAIITYLFLFYNTDLKVNAAVVGTALFIPRLWDAITDPIMGQISDKTRTRWGRRRPYIGFGSILLGLTVFFLWAPPAYLDVKGLGTYLLAMSILFYTAYTIVLVPYYSLGAEMTTDYHERTNIQGYRTAFRSLGAFAGAFTYWFAHCGLFSNIRTGFAFTGMICALLATVSLGAAAMGSREQTNLAPEPSIPLKIALRAFAANVPFMILFISFTLFVLGAFASYPLANYVIKYYVLPAESEHAARLISISAGLTNIVVILCVPFITRMSTRVEKKTALLAAFAGVAILPLATWFLFTPSFPSLIYVFFLFLGVPAAAVQIVIYSMLADICDLDELKCGQKRVGAYFGWFAFLAKLGGSAVVLVQAWLLSLTGFDQNLDLQVPETVHNMRLALALFPLIIAVIAALILYWYPLNAKRVAEVRTLLDRRANETQGTEPRPV